MSIVSLTLARNEEDVVEAFVRYHAEILDRMVVIDHLSTDRTPEIVERLRREGLPVELRRETAPDHCQAEALTAAMHEVAGPGGADWILPLDADEFLVSPDAEFATVLAGLSGRRVYKLGWRTYIPTPYDDPDEKSLFRRLRHRRTLEDPYHHKVLIPRRLARRCSCRLTQGNHKLLYRWRDGADVELPAELLASVWLAHFPIRSAFQLTQKVLLGWPSNLARHPRPRLDAYHWRQLYARCSTGVPFTAAELHEVALGYSIGHADVRRQGVALDPFTGFEPLEERVVWPQQGFEVARLLMQMVGAAEQLARRVSTLGSRCEEYESSCRELAAKLRDEQNELRVVQQSRSWRWTAPLRRLERLRHRRAQSARRRSSTTV